MKILKEGSVSTSLDVKAVSFSESEFKRAIRQAIIAELDAVNMYTKMADSVTDPYFRKIILDIADEEQVHVGEFQSMLYTLSPKDSELHQQGQEENQE